ncbi:hypothetical protein V497_03039 [Pseudogymnoascus sp. VKM F-4516 (FW-969)]|nr:hypothetical protein V497_03039 [Pseudogymnoascus sp. VKM F-4516 (FW-969)]
MLVSQLEAYAYVRLEWQTVNEEDEAGCILYRGTTYLIVNPKFQGRPSRKFCVCMFISTAFSGFAPLAHGIKIYGLAQMQRQSGLPYFLAEGLLLIMGALFYTMRFPESLKPALYVIIF